MLLEIFENDKGEIMGVREVPESEWTPEERIRAVRKRLESFWGAVDEAFPISSQSDLKPTHVRDLTPEERVKCDEITRRVTEARQRLESFWGPVDEAFPISHQCH